MFYCNVVIKSFAAEERCSKLGQILHLITDVNLRLLLFLFSSQFVNSQIIEKGLIISYVASKVCLDLSCVQ